jgi:hypothetical protein
MAQNAEKKVKAIFLSLVSSKGRTKANFMENFKVKGSLQSKVHEGSKIQKKRRGPMLFLTSSDGKIKNHMGNCC